MEMHNDEDYEYAFDKQLNNHFLKKYIYEPFSRNKIVISIKDIYNAIDIVNAHIKDFIQFLLNYRRIDYVVKLEIQSNEYNTGVSIELLDNIPDLEVENLALYIESYGNIQYLEINKKIYIDKKFTDYLSEDILLKRNFKSFHQNDDVVKKYLYNFLLMNSGEINNLILFGGEMYGFPLLLKPKNLYAYSDFDSIVEDTIHNTPEYINQVIKLIDYDIYKYDLSLSDSIVICNTSKNGLGYNLAKQINKINARILFIISCNKKSFIKDYLILSEKYKIIKNLEINNINLYYFIGNFMDK